MNVKRKKAPEFSSKFLLFIYCYAKLDIQFYFAATAETGIVTVCTYIIDRKRRDK